MLNKNKAHRKKSMIDTMIGANTVIRGTIIAEETLRIDGVVVGEAISGRAVIVGAEGRMEGDVTAESILVAGRVKGNINVREKTEITRNGSVEGDITTKILVIDEGAAFKGSSFMEVPEEGIEDTKTAESLAAAAVSEGRNTACRAAAEMIGDGEFHGVEKI